MMMNPFNLVSLSVFSGQNYWDFPYALKYLIRFNKGLHYKLVWCLDSSKLNVQATKCAQNRSLSNLIDFAIAEKQFDSRKH